MVSAKAIQETCNDIIREFAPQQVILFGSYAYGTPTEDSDVDLFVVMTGLVSNAREEAWEMKKRLPERFRLDLHVRSPEELAYRISHNDWFLREILEKGDVLYENGQTSPGAGTCPIPGQLEALVPIWQEAGAMNPLTLEWVEVAEGDYESVKLHVQRSSKRRRYNITCFNAQQCIEKYLKAWLQEANLPTRRTHELNELLDVIVPVRPAWEAWRSDFSAFDKYAVDARYPGYIATEADAEHAVGICNEVRQTVRDMLALGEEAD